MLFGIAFHIIFVAAVAAMLAGFVQRVSGFAFGIVFLSILPYILPYGEAVIISKILILILSVSTAFIYRKDVDWKIAKTLIFTLCIFDIVGILVLKNLDLSNFKCYLGLFLALLGFYSLFLKRDFTIKPNRILSFVVGAITGFCSGIFGLGGPFLAIYLSNIALDKNVYYATMQFSVFFLMVFDVFMRISQGFMTIQAVQITALTLPFAFIGTLLGTALFRKLNGKIVNKLINIIMILNGLNMFFSR